MCEFWTAFGAIGTTAGSLVTAAAVIVAIRQYKLPLRKKLHIKFSRSRIIPAYDNIKNDFYYVSVSNIGIREVNINGIYLFIGKYAIIDKRHDMQLPFTRIEVPIILKPEENLQYVLMGEKIDDAIREIIEKGDIKPSDKVKILVTDSSGNNYYCKIKQRARDLFDKFSEL
jgi:hypothetical protein